MASVVCQLFREISIRQSWKVVKHDANDAALQSKTFQRLTWRHLPSLVSRLPLETSTCCPQGNGWLEIFAAFSSTSSFPTINYRNSIAKSQRCRFPNWQLISIISFQFLILIEVGWGQCWNCEWTMEMNCQVSAMSGGGVLGRFFLGRRSQVASPLNLIAISKSNFDPQIASHLTSSAASLSLSLSGCWCC